MSKVYKIVSNRSSDYYIGYTQDILSNRIAAHRNLIVPATREWIRDNPTHKFYIVLIEQYEVLSKEDLLKKAEEWALKLNPTIPIMSAKKANQCVHGNSKRTCTECNKRLCPNCKREYGRSYIIYHKCNPGETREQKEQPKFELNTCDILYIDHTQ